MGSECRVRAFGFSVVMFRGFGFRGLQSLTTAHGLGFGVGDLWVRVLSPEL